MTERKPACTCCPWEGIHTVGCVQNKARYLIGDWQRDTATLAFDVQRETLQERIARALKDEGGEIVGSLCSTHTAEGHLQPGQRSRLDGYRCHVCLWAKLKTAEEALKFYAGEDPDGGWQDNRFVAFDKFGAVSEEISGPKVAQDALAEIRKGL